ncbi:MAG: hypothetical protein KBG48_15625 [Kofleriaceae bacterium]|nr:hypothetical protein [Kofleriaceae bacterium]MBP9168827.1 hypothetical protein [Kofleriaceae bacterium]MBP9862400.1 hypothetical protein [Kofleriaceae bacterium]
MAMLVARDAAAADQLVYPYPFPLGPAIDVSCSNDEVVVLCPAWAVNGLLGPGRHQWQSPEPGKPLAVYFVLTGPVDVDFDMVTSFTPPTTGLPVTLRASGSVLVRVADPGMLIAQFVGLPFDRVNDGLKASVATSVERLLGKVLPRKVALAGTPTMVTDPAMRPSLIEELTSYNPGIGAVYGLQFVRFVSLEVAQVGPDLQPIDVGGWLNARSSPGLAPPPEAAGWVSGREPTGAGASPPLEVSGWIGGREPTGTGPAVTEVSGWIGGRGDDREDVTAKHTSSPALPVAAEPVPEVAPSPPAPTAVPAVPAAAAPSTPAEPPVLAAGTPVLVSMADGLLHAATVRSAMQGYYELEIGGSDQPLWVGQHQVTPQV